MHFILVEQAEASSRNHDEDDKKDNNKKLDKDKKASNVLMQKKEEEAKRKAMEDARKKEELAKIRKEREEMEQVKREARAKEDEAAKKKLADEKEAKRINLEAKRELIKKDRESKQKKNNANEGLILSPKQEVKTNLSPRSFNAHSSAKVSTKHSPRQIYKGGFEISHSLLIISITDDGVEWNVSAYDNSNSQEYSLKIRSSDIDKVDGDIETIAEDLLKKLSLDDGKLKYSK